MPAAEALARDADPVVAEAGGWAVTRLQGEKEVAAF